MFFSLFFPSQVQKVIIEEQIGNSTPYLVYYAFMFINNLDSSSLES